MDTVYLTYAILGACVLVLALGAGPIKKFLWISEPLFILLVGIAVGPIGVGLLDSQQFGNPNKVLEELARLTLAMSLMGVALRLPNTWIRERWRALTVILLLGMPLMWIVSSLCGWFVLGLPALQALLLGALVTPTDPVVSSSIVTGDLAEEHVDADVRHLISAESGANDGLAFLLVMLPALLLEHAPAEALTHWAVVVLFGKVIGSILGGILVGFIVAKVLDRTYQWEHAHHASLLAVTSAIALTLLGSAKLLHGDGILAIFAAGLTFNWIIREEKGHEEAQHERMQETIKRFFDVPVFGFFGMMLPWHDWAAIGWPLAGFTAAVLLFRRVPILLLLFPLLGPVHRIRDALFIGWFGPVAVAAMFYATWVEAREGSSELWTIGSFVIFVSIIVHGVTAIPLTRLYGRTRVG